MERIDLGGNGNI